MFERLHRATVFALYQLSVVTGIVLLPFAILARRVGVSLPVHRLVSAMHDAYDDATEAGS